LGEPVTAFFLGLLALAWIAVFLPAVLRARQNSPISTAERFRRLMRVMAPHARTGRWVVVPEPHESQASRSHRRGQQRRLHIFVSLVAAAGLSGAVALLAGGGMWEVNLALDASLALYVSLLLEAKRRREERERKVHTMATRRAQVSFEGRAEAYGVERF
jgi:hypothetical protein